MSRRPLRDRTSAWLLAPLVALQFLTVIPLRLPAAPPRTQGAAVGYFPAVGGLLGLAAGLTDALAQPVLAAPVRAVVDLIVLAVLSGALHLDAVADAADGLLGSTSRARRLEIMREPTVGAFGITALIFVLLVEWTALSQIPSPARLGGLVVAATVARWAMVILLVLPNARPDSVGSGFRIRWRSPELWFSTATAVVVTVLFGAPVVALLTLAAVVAGTAGALALARLGGVTGDLCGAAGEVVMATSLVALSAR